MCPNKNFTQMFIAALFIIVKKWKPQKCSLIQRIDKMWHIHTREYCSSIKKE
jgi:hypothetical protein